MMICPDCHSELPEGTASCPHCARVVRQEAEALPLWSDTGPDPVGASGAREATSINVRRYGEQGGGAPGSRDEAAALGVGDERAVFTSADDGRQAAPHRPAFGPRDERAIHTQLAPSDPQQVQHTRIVEVSLPPVVKRAMRDKAEAAGEGANGVEPETSLYQQLAREVRHFYVRLHRIDRYTVWTLLATLVATFSPWFFERGVGLSAGIEGAGALSSLAVVGAAVAIHARTNRRRLSGTLVMLQFVLVVLVAAPPLYHLLLGGRQLVIGAHVTLAGAAVAAFLTLARLTRLNV